MQLDARPVRAVDGLGQGDQRGLLQPAQRQEQERQGKELQRQLGVTYKTAWRMGQQIRDLMAKADGFTALKGHVEIDETFVGGKKEGNAGRVEYMRPNQDGSCLNASNG